MDSETETELLGDVEAVKLDEKLEDTVALTETLGEDEAELVLDILNDFDGELLVEALKEALMVMEGVALKDGLNEEL